MRLDPLSLLGVALGLMAIVGGNALDGGQLSSLVNGPALVIVFGGTVGAVLLQTPFPVFYRALGLVRNVVHPPEDARERIIKRVLHWSQVARRDGLLGLENLSGREPDEFARKGLQLVVDGHDPEVIRGVLEVDLEMREQQDIEAARVFEGMGGYAPTLGILGAVMGLIHVMQNLADPARLGDGIATAFVATIYGVGFANLLFLPIANKLKIHAHRASHRREMLIEGMISIADGDNPRHIETRLRSYLH